MKNTITLKLNKDFRKLYFNAKYKSNKFIVTYLIKNNKNINRIGITTSKKIGNAVVRNRSKRIIRAAFLELEKSLPLGYDFVFVARNEIVNLKSYNVYYHIQKQINFLIKNI